MNALALFHGGSGRRGRPRRGAQVETVTEFGRPALEGRARARLGEAEGNRSDRGAPWGPTRAPASSGGGGPVRDDTDGDHSSRRSGPRRGGRPGSRPRRPARRARRDRRAPRRVDRDRASTRCPRRCNDTAFPAGPRSRAPISSSARRTSLRATIRAGVDQQDAGRTGVRGPAFVRPARRTWCSRQAPKLGEHTREIHLRDPVAARRGDDRPALSPRVAPRVPRQFWTLLQGCFVRPGGGRFVGRRPRR